MASLLYRLGRFSYRRWWVVLGIWLIALIGVGAVSSAVAKDFEDSFEIPGSEAVAAQEVLAEKFPEATGTDQPTARIVLATTDGTRLDSPENRTAIAAVVERLQQIPQLTDADRATIIDPTNEVVAPQALSPDGQAGIISITFDAQRDGIETGVTEESIAVVSDAKRLGEDAGLRIESAGAGNEPMAEPPAELIGIAVAIVVMVITFAALMAAAMPLIAALLGIIGSTSIIMIGTSFLTLGSSTTGLASMIGLAVGIDYSLFVISRYRSETTKTSDRAHAAGIAVGTAGSAVVFAGATVIIALIALSVTGMSFLSQMGLGAAVTVLLAVLVALTVLPALLGLFKSVVFKPRIPGLWTPERATKTTMGGRVAQALVRRPLPYLLVAVVVLLLAALPIGKIELGLDVTPQADKAAVQMQSQAFGAGKSSPLIAVISAENAESLQATASEFIAQVSGLGHVAEGGIIGPVPNAAGDAAQVIIVPDSGPSTRETSTLLDEVRGIANSQREATGAFIGIGGEAAISADFSHVLTSKLPLYLLVVVGLAFLLLMIVFRSVVVPLIASLGFLLSIAATFGVTVGVFQLGWFGWIPPESQGPILVFMPIFLIGIVFGLAMDYQVFLVSRMREEYHHGAATSDAITIGYRDGARVIAAAAIIMISVFAGFTLSSETFLKLMGFAMAAAIVFDAFLVRMVIMPTAMALLGDRVWWMPRWLDRVLPSIDVEGSNLRTIESAPPADSGAGVPVTSR